jgi:hypothetical protein
MRGTGAPDNAKSMMPQAPTLTLPPDLDIGTSLGRCQNQLRQGRCNLDASKRLGEQICGHVCGVDVVHGADAAGCPLHQSVSQPVIVASSTAAANKIESSQNSDKEENIEELLPDILGDGKTLDELPKPQ